MFVKPQGNNFCELRWSSNVFRQENINIVHDGGQYLLRWREWTSEEIYTDFPGYQNWTLIELIM